MNEILHANIFFVIASVGTVVFIVLVSMVLFHIFKIVKLVRSILEKIEQGTEILAEDAAKIRSFLANGSFFSRIFSMFFGGMASERPKRRGRKSVKVIKEEVE